MAGLRKYAETEGVLDEVSHLFSGDEDQQIIAKLRKLEEETRALAAQKQAEVKDHIRGAAHRSAMRPARRASPRRKPRAEVKREASGLTGAPLCVVFPTITRTRRPEREHRAAASRARSAVRHV